MLPARNRMTRSTDFRVTVNRGVRAAQRDLVVHSLAPGAPDGAESNTEDAPKVGLVVGKSVGNAVQRHRVSRQLRHASRDLLPELRSGELLVIRALPGSREAATATLQDELRVAVQRAHAKSGSRQ
ncbi:ribonuclease P protein component [Mycolicibacterium llatzerense]|uniref:ribonuclease P protein component n=1 Tax=Mycolicibacterium llatzerense TaxID=280871 RepID=UPI0021B58A50|nr:ribonuclease P protein component [Mycolicibacterium llatzerense]MCT7362297.1 ribonuclease P protein component [Mycolicibacterium llatzerense]